MKWSEDKGNLVDVELPMQINTYDELGSFPFHQDRFLELAKILGKRVEVYREDGGTGEHIYMYGATPTGEIVEPSELYQS